MSPTDSLALREEHAALHRLATLVAGGSPSEEVFTAVAEEVGRLLPVDYAALSRYESDGSLTYLATWSATGDPYPPVGTRVSLGGSNVGSLVFETGRPARIDDYGDATGPLVDNIRKHGVRSAVGTPILVGGRVWGVIAVGSVQALPLAGDTEARLASFTELVAAAIANAESRDDLARLAEEQAGLRRIATLVARGVPHEEVFLAVTAEVLRVLPVEFARLGRYETDGTIEFVATWGIAEAFLPTGTRLKLGGNNVSTLVAETGCAARIDRYGDASGPIGIAVREMGFRSAVGIPIAVEDRLWGVMIVASTSAQPLPADTEASLSQFAELLAMSVANAESRASLARLAEEQAALRRVATLVAQGVPAEALFAAAAEEVGKLLGVEYTHLGRYGPGETLTSVAAWTTSAPLMPVGSQFPLGGKNLATTVFETGRPARIDSSAERSGPIGEVARQSGIRSAVATPIIVEGRLWGTMGAGSITQPLAADAEERLTQFTDILATAIANAQTRAELTASRARIVAAADETRRRIERDLHDGAQQRLVHTVIVQQLALRALETGEPNVAELMAEALHHAERANSELGELAHGILPSVLTREGLRAGVRALVSRMSLPVRVDIVEERFPAGVEATAYFVISEALTNVVKHAQADGAEVIARVERGMLHVEVCDDGVGGAQIENSTGLRGLEDRVSALGGRLVVESLPGRGTRVHALVPVECSDHPAQRA